MRAADAQAPLTPEQHGHGAQPRADRDPLRRGRIPPGTGLQDPQGQWDMGPGVVPRGDLPGHRDLAVQAKQNLHPGNERAPLRPNNSYINRIFTEGSMYCQSFR